MIQVVEKLADLRAQFAAWKRDGLRVALVPTMGNLHAGHHSLVALAREHADRVVASIFVNPTQFGPNEDFERYPRTPDADRDGLDNAGCDLLWMPSVDVMYPFGPDACVAMRVPGITDVLDGAHRPGHFDGVVTVVSRLFNQVQADTAVFGRKDFQQLAVIRYLVRDLAFPVAIIAARIVREPDGLAMSSRNQYLNSAQRGIAPTIQRTLQSMCDAIRAGQSPAAAEHDAAKRLGRAGFVVDYAVVRTPALLEPEAIDAGMPLVALVAARLGSTRLIDNVEFVV